MENYTFLLFPDKEITNKINDFRNKNGFEIVDGLQPHVSLKRRFLFDKAGEKDLVDFLHNFQMAKICGKAKKIKRFGDALVLVIESKNISKCHFKIIEELKEKNIIKAGSWGSSKLATHTVHLFN